MRPLLTVLCLSSLAAASLPSARVVAAEVDARPPDRFILIANGSRLTGTDDGGGGSINWLHYFNPDAIFGVGAEHQFIADSHWTFASVRGALSRGQPASRFSVFGEVHHGDGDDDGRDFDYSVAVLGLSQAFTSKFSVQLEGRQIDIDTTHGNLPKLGLSYLWTPRLLTNVSYAHSVGGNLGTELITARIDHYGRYVTLMAGGASGRADPTVLNLQPGLTLPTRNLKQGFVGIGKAFARGEVQLLGDYLELAESERVTLTLSFTAYLGSRGRAQ
jgi:hypothetical protein